MIYVRFTPESGHTEAQCPLTGPHRSTVTNSKIYFGCFAPLSHLLRVLVEPSLDGLKDVFVLPAGNPALLARGAAILDGASLAAPDPTMVARGADIGPRYVRFRG